MTGADEDGDGPSDDPDRRESTAGDGSQTAAADESTAAADESTAAADESTAAADESTAAADEATHPTATGTAAEDESTADDDGRAYTDDDGSAHTAADEPVHAPAEADADPAAVPLGESQSLASVVRYYWLVGSAIGAAVTAAFVGFAAFVVQQVGPSLPASPRTITLAAFALLVGVGAVRSVLRYRAWAYVVRGDSLYLRRGVFTRVESVVPYVRVQHIDSRRGAVERLFGLSSLVVYTAGSRGADVTIPGLTPDRAASLQTRLKRLAIESEEEDAV